MKVAIMQPYFFPYIGYIQLINAVDVFVIYDNVEFSKNSWINRNRILNNLKDDYITLPIKKGSNILKINQRFIADTWDKEKIKIKNKIKNTYSKANNFLQVFSLFQKCMDYTDLNLCNFINNTILNTCAYLHINTKIILASKLDINHSLKGQNKVIEICKLLNASMYINSIGGIDLYQKEIFLNENINLFFLKSNSIAYNQFNNTYLPSLSIIDVLMFNDISNIQSMLNQYELI